MDKSTDLSPQPSCACLPFARWFAAGSRPDTRANQSDALACAEPSQDGSRGLRAKPVSTTLLPPYIRAKQNGPQLHKLHFQCPSPAVVCDSSTSVVSAAAKQTVNIKAPAASASSDYDDDNTPVSERAQNALLSGLEQQAPSVSSSNTSSPEFVPSATDASDCTLPSRLSRATPTTTSVAAPAPHSSDASLQTVRLPSFKGSTSTGPLARRPSLLSRPQLGAEQSALPLNRPSIATTSTSTAAAAAASAAAAGGACLASTHSSFTTAACSANNIGVVELASTPLPTLPATVIVAAAAAAVTPSTTEPRTFPSPPTTALALGAGPDLLASLLSDSNNGFGGGGGGGAAGGGIGLLPLFPASSDTLRQQSPPTGLSSVLSAETGAVSTSAVEQLRQQLWCEQQQGSGGRPIEVANLEEVGKGSFGVVYRGVWQGARVACKYLVASSTQQLQVSATEALLAKLLAHPNVVQTFACKVLELTPEFFADSPEHTAASDALIPGVHHSSAGGPQPPVSGMDIRPIAAVAAETPPPPPTSVDTSCPSTAAARNGSSIYTGMCAGDRVINVVTLFAPSDCAVAGVPPPAAVASHLHAAGSTPGAGDCDTSSSNNNKHLNDGRNRVLQAATTAATASADAAAGTGVSIGATGAFSSAASCHQRFSPAPFVSSGAGLSSCVNVSVGCCITALERAPSGRSQPEQQPQQPDKPSTPALQQYLAHMFSAAAVAAASTEAASVAEPQQPSGPLPLPLTVSLPPPHSADELLAQQAEQQQLGVLGRVGLRSQSASAERLHNPLPPAPPPQPQQVWSSMQQPGLILQDSEKSGGPHQPAMLHVGPIEGREGGCGAGEQQQPEPGRRAEEPLAIEASALDSFHSGDGFGAPYLGDEGFVRPPSDSLSQYRLLLSQLKANPRDFLTQIIMEYCDRGSLQLAIEKRLFLASPRWNARVALRAMLRTAREIAQGMCHLHSSQIVHGDLKPANVLLKSSRADRRGFVAKVADFGLSKMLPLEDRGSLECDTDATGTLPYMAPEVLNGSVCPAADVYSFGVILWQLATGQRPFADIHPGRMWVGIGSGDLQLEWPADTHPMLRKLGEECLSIDKRQRPPFTKVARRLGVIELVVRNEGAAQQAAAALAAAAAGSGSGSNWGAATAATQRLPHHGGVAATLAGSSSSSQRRLLSQALLPAYLRINQPSQAPYSGILPYPSSGGGASFTGGCGGGGGAGVNSPNIYSVVSATSGHLYGGAYVSGGGGLSGSILPTHQQVHMGSLAPVLPGSPLYGNALQSGGAASESGSNLATPLWVGRSAASATAAGAGTTASPRLVSPAVATSTATAEGNTAAGAPLRGGMKSSSSVGAIPRMLLPTEEAIGGGDVVMGSAGGAAPAGVDGFGAPAAGGVSVASHAQLPAFGSISLGYLDHPHPHHQHPLVASSMPPPPPPPPPHHQQQYYSHYPQQYMQSPLPQAGFQPPHPNPPPPPQHYYLPQPWPHGPPGDSHPPQQHVQQQHPALHGLISPLHTSYTQPGQQRLLQQHYPDHLHHRHHNQYHNQPSPQPQMAYWPHPQCQQYHQQCHQQQQNYQQQCQQQQHYHQALPIHVAPHSPAYSAAASIVGASRHPHGDSSTGLTSRAVPELAEAVEVREGEQVVNNACFGGRQQPQQQQQEAWEGRWQPRPATQCLPLPPQMELRPDAILEGDEEGPRSD